MNRSILILLIFIIISFQKMFPQETADKITFIPHWLPQAQFAGYYAAHDLGIYKKYNLDVEIHTGGPQNPSSEVIKKKEADIASLWLTNGRQESRPLGRRFPDPAP